ncbi:MAG: NAD(P)/FAD-dependent oxidoreductase [Candidatus Omnitrophica bacterium]|nr:NAD(P)/FAD-dependent oxidoreductase [Candidatus Omnitrophota bacterium]
MKQKKQIVIVGAGPVGCYLAQLLKKEGANPLLVEEHKEIGRPLHCAGLVGKKVFEETKIPLSDRCILNTINGAVFHMNNEKISIRRKEVAYVIDRETFDKHLGRDLNINFETRFLGLEKQNGSYLIETDRGHLEADIVVGAEGAKSVLRECVAGNHTQYLKGVQFRMQVKLEHVDMVEVYIKKPYFYWIIPESNEIVRVGVLSKNPYQDLINFIEEINLKGKTLEKFAGIVPLTHFSSLSRERIFLVGDSASQIKPLSYGGIYMGMRAAEILCGCIINEKFDDYSMLWSNKFGKEIDFSLQLRHVFSKLTDPDIEKIFAFLKKRTDIIEKKGDFENHSLLLWEFLKQPDITGDILNILFRIIKNSLGYSRKERV